MTSLDLTIYKGSTFNLNIVALDTGGNAIDLTNFTSSGYLKKRYSDSDLIANLNSSVIDASGGTLSLSIPVSGTAILPIGYLFYDVKITHTGSLATTGIFMGKASVYPDVTF